MTEISKLVAEAVDEGTEALVEAYPAFEKSLNYVLGQEGKRLRAKFCAQVGLSLGVSESRLKPVLFVLEAIHCGSLVQDDLPMLDDDAVRRGKPACHVKFSEAEAMLLGDILLGPCLSVVLQSKNLTRQSKVDISERVLSVVGRISAGQLLEKKLDRAGQPTEDELLGVDSLKTGALFELAFSAPCFLLEKQDPRQIAALERFGLCFGMLFQLADDVADSKTDREATNIACALPQTRLIEIADEFYEEAEDILARLEGLSAFEDQLVAIRDAILVG